MVVLLEDMFDGKEITLRMLPEAMLLCQEGKDDSDGKPEAREAS